MIPRIRRGPSSRPRSLVFLLVALLVAGPLTAQQPTGADNGKKVLTLADYGRWSTVQSVDISDGGRWMTYAYAPNDGDPTFFIRDLAGQAVDTVPRGSNPIFSDDGHWVAYMVSPTEEEAKKLREKRERVKREAVLRNLATDEVQRFPDAGEIRFSPDSRSFVVRRPKADRDAEFDGTDLVVKDLTTGVVRNIGNVSDFAFNDSGSRLAWLVDAQDGLGNGLYVLDPASGATAVLSTSERRYSGLSWNEDGDALAVLRGETPDGKLRRENGLLVFRDLTPGSEPAAEYAPSDDSDFPEGMVLSELGGVEWSKDGRRIFLGVKEQRDEVKRSREPMADVDVWHWKDEEVQARQMANADRDKRFTYKSVYNLDDGRFLRLADDDMRRVTPTGDGRYAIGQLDAPYRHEVSWGGSRADFYRVDLNTGERSLMVKGLARNMGTSPDGQWFLYLEDGDLKVREVASGQTKDLSEIAGVNFVNVDDDHPYEKPAYGVAGWAKDGSALIAYHRYDIWSLPLKGGEAKNLTGGTGDARQIRFRVVNLERDDEGGGGGFQFFGRGGGRAQELDLSQPLLLSAYGEWTKKSGYFSLRPDGDLEEVYYRDEMVGSGGFRSPGIMKAEDADRVLFTRQTFQRFPDWWTSDMDFHDPKQVTDANPQQAEYLWGSRVLVDYTDQRGHKLQATLTLPAGYQKGKRYPMLVYFYEKQSQNHHQYSQPRYDDRPQMSTYASDGYLVLMPDIVYDIGSPGSSALDDIGSAVHKAIDLGYADPDHIGLQGHSWGGYQSSFLVTQTDMFAAVVTGAPVTDLVSFYDELYGRTGNVQQGIMEKGQVRMGVDLWDGLEQYRSQSPVHQAQNIHTPFLILQGTADDAVDWHQGLEFYNAAKRLGKKVIFLSYPGEPHHLQKEENQKDFQGRMKQFFDHYLKDSPAPKWMADGVPFLEKEYERGRLLPGASRGRPSGLQPNGALEHLMY